jgi:hypothetical protein
VGKKDWIKGAVKKPGALHRALGIPEGKKIPAGKLEVKPGDSTLMKRRKNLAKTLTFMSSR